jgi:hypothetical protein
MMKSIFLTLAFTAAVVAVILSRRAGLIEGVVANSSVIILILLAIGTMAYQARGHRAGTGTGRFVLTAYGTAVGFAVIAATAVMIWCALLMLGVFPKIVTALYNTRCRLQNRTGRIAVLQCLQAAVLLGGTAALAGTWGLVAVGWAALAAEAVPALILAPTVVRWLRTPSAS